MVPPGPARLHATTSVNGPTACPAPRPPSLLRARASALFPALPVAHSRPALPPALFRALFPALFLVLHQSTTRSAADAYRSTGNASIHRTT